MDERYMLRDQVSKEDREFMQRLYRRAAKPKEQLEIICDLFPYHTKKQIKVVLGLERETKAPEKQKEYNEMRRSYDQATKDAVVKDVLLHGISQPQVSEKYGIPISNINRWVTKAIKQRQDIEDYADKIEQELVAEKQEIKTEDVFPATHFKPANNQEEIQQEKSYSQMLLDYRELRYDDPERQAMEAEIKRAEAEMKVEAETVVAETGTEKPFSVQKVDENTIKAAAYDAITIQMAMYPDSSTDTMMRFIQGVQALAQILCDEVE